MRAFDTFEKEILTKIKQLNEFGTDVTFTGLLDHFINNRGVKIDPIQKKAYLLFDAHVYSRLINEERQPSTDLSLEVKKFNHNVIKLIILLSYLEKEGLIYTYSSEEKSYSPSSYARITSDQEPLREPIADAKLIQLITSHFDKNIFPSQGLLDCVSNGYKDFDAIAMEKNLKVSEESLALTKSSLLDNKNSLTTLEKNLTETQYLIEDSIAITQRGMRYSDMALTVAIITGILGTVIASVSAYYSFSQIGKHTQSLSDKFRPISQKLTRMDFEFVAIREKMDNIKITDTIHARVVDMPKDTINTRLIENTTSKESPKKNNWTVKKLSTSIDPN